MRFILIALSLLCFAVPAQARHTHHHKTIHLAHHAAYKHYAHRQHLHYARRAIYQRDAVELPHPSGCPATEFCGCGASVEVFGHSVRDLWLAANWFRFPPTQPAPGMVAVRSHHVMVIRNVVGPDTAVVFDANSSHHRTQIHTVSLAGYSIRNPRGD